MVRRTVMRSPRLTCMSSADTFLPSFSTSRTTVIPEAADAISVVGCTNCAYTAPQEVSGEVFSTSSLRILSAVFATFTYPRPAVALGIASFCPLNLNVVGCAWLESSCDELPFIKANTAFTELMGVSQACVRFSWSSQRCISLMV